MSDGRHCQVVHCTFTGPAKRMPLLFCLTLNQMRCQNTLFDTEACSHCFRNLTRLSTSYASAPYCTATATVHKYQVFLSHIYAHRLAKRAQTLRRALDAAEQWGVREHRRMKEQVRYIRSKNCVLLFCLDPPRTIRDYFGRCLLRTLALASM